MGVVDGLVSKDAQCLLVDAGCKYCVNFDLYPMHNLYSVNPIVYIRECWDIASWHDLHLIWAANDCLPSVVSPPPRPLTTGGMAGVTSYTRA